MIDLIHVIWNKEWISHDFTHKMIGFTEQDETVKKKNKKDNNWEVLDAVDESKKKRKK